MAWSGELYGGWIGRVPRNREGAAGVEIEIPILRQALSKIPISRAKDAREMGHPCSIGIRFAQIPVCTRFTSMEESSRSRFDSRSGVKSVSQGRRVDSATWHGL